MYILLNPAILRDYTPYVWRDYDRPPEEVAVRDTFRPVIMSYEDSMREARVYAYRAAFRPAVRKPRRYPLKLISMWDEFF